MTAPEPPRKAGGLCAASTGLRLSASDIATAAAMPHVPPEHADRLYDMSAKLYDIADETDLNVITEGN